LGLTTSMDRFNMQKILDEFENSQKELIHILHRVQAKFGYIPPDAISEISRHLKITESEIYGVLTFYSAFSLEPRGKHTVTVCMGTACHVRGGPKVLEELERRLEIEAGNTTKDKQFTLETVACLGCCAIGPVVVVDDDYHAQATISKVEQILEKYKKGKRNDQN